MSENEAKFVVSANASPYEAAMQRAVAATSQAVSSIKERFESINETVAKVGKAFVALTVAIEGAKAVKDLADSAAEISWSSAEMGKQFGIGATAASQLRVALGDALVTQDQYQGAVNRVTRTLATNEEAFRDLG